MIDNLEKLEKYSEEIIILLEHGVFEVKNGQAILNFNSQGQLANIELRYKTYKLENPN